MKVKRLHKKFSTEAKLTDKRAPFVDMAIDHLNDVAIDGIPYNAQHLFDQLQKKNLFQTNKEGICILALAIDELLKNHGWQIVSAWGFYCCGTSSVKIKQVIDGICATGYPFTVASIAETIEHITGEEASLDQLGKTLRRLVETKRFVNVDRGVYKRIYQGM